MTITEDEREYWTERAGIFEAQGLMPRADAERMADEALAVYRLSRMTGRQQARDLAQRLRQ